MRASPSAKEFLPYDSIERLALVEMRPHNMTMGDMPRIYRLLRGDGPPLTYRIATELAGVDAGRFGLFTGMVIPQGFPHGEIDGPVGVVVLGRALELLEHTAEIIVPDGMEPVIAAMQQVVTTAMPVKPASSLTRGAAAEWAEGYDGAIAVEKLGRNAKGVRHTIRGTVVADEEKGLDPLFDALLLSGKFTLGVGDYGNEIGFGKVFHLARDMVPLGADCGCPCHGGIITTTATKHLVPAAVSNIGCYAVAAALSVWNKRDDLLPEGKTVVNMIEAGVEAGAVDGETATAKVADDGVPAPTIESIVTIFRTIVTKWFMEFRRGF